MAAVLIALALLGAEPATTAPAPVILWRGLGEATTKAEMRAFKAALPGRRAELLPGCKVEVMYRFVKGTLASIVLLGNSKDAPCAETLLSNLTAQYGPSRASDQSQASMPIAAGGMVFSHSFTRRDHVWFAEGRRVVLALMPPNGTGYNLIFTVRPEKYLY